MKFQIEDEIRIKLQLEKLRRHPKITVNASEKI